MNYSLFDHDAAFDEAAVRSARVAASVAKVRVAQALGNFLANANGSEVEDRLEYVASDLEAIVAEVVEGHGGDAEVIERTIADAYRFAAGGFCDDCRKWKTGPRAGCECGDTGAKKDSEDENDPESDDIEKELSDAPSAIQSSRLAVDAPTLDTAEKRVKVDRQREGPVPKMDKGRWTTLPDIKTEGKGSPHPTLTQDVTDRPDYADTPPRQLGDALNQTDAVTKSQDVGKETTTERIHTDTWSGTDGQASPVTRQPTSATQDPDKNPIREMLESGYLPETQITAALDAWQDR